MTMNYLQKTLDTVLASCPHTLDGRTLGLKVYGRSEGLEEEERLEERMYGGIGLGGDSIDILGLAQFRAQVMFGVLRHVSTLP